MSSHHDFGSKSGWHSPRHVLSNSETYASSMAHKSWRTLLTRPTSLVMKRPSCKIEWQNKSRYSCSILIALLGHREPHCRSSPSQRGVVESVSIPTSPHSISTLLEITAACNKNDTNIRRVHEIWPQTMVIEHLRLLTQAGCS